MFPGSFQIGDLSSYEKIFDDSKGHDKRLNFLAKGPKILLTGNTVAQDARFSTLAPEPLDQRWIMKRTSETGAPVEKKGRNLFCSGRGIISLFKLFKQEGNDLPEICNHAKISGLKDRRLRVVVNRDDHLGILDSHHVLNDPGNPDADVELGRMVLPLWPII